MNHRVRDILGIAVIVAVLVLAYASVSYVGSYAKSIQPSSFRSFSVSGQGKVVAVPDVAKFTFKVITEGGKDVASLQNANTGKVNKAIEYVKSKGVDAKDIETQGYNVEPRYQYYSCKQQTVSAGTAVSPCPPAEIVGYTITQSVEVKVRDFSKAGDILSGVVGSGANSVSSLNFTIDDPTRVQSEARAQAIQKAKEQAETVAKAGGFKVGRLLSIDEGYSPVYDRSYGMGGSNESMKSMSAAPVPAIEPGSQDIVVNVNLRYEID